MNLMQLERWPELKYDDWKDTLDTIHMWTQIVGKIRMRLEPLVNHWWNAALYVTERGLTTSSMPYREGRWLSIEFDFLEHVLRIDGCDGEKVGFALKPMTVAEFYRRLFEELRAIDIDVTINRKPNEVPEAIPFDEDTKHKSHDAKYVERFWRATLQADRLCKEFRSRFLGKVSPVHFFWGGFDLAVTRFSGRTAPPYPGGVPNVPNSVMLEAYSHEVQSVGFFVGGWGLDTSFYSYAYPTLDGFAQAKVKPAAAGWNDQLREFILPYEAVRTSSTADSDVLDFFQSTYEAAADLAKWDRKALERA